MSDLFSRVMTGGVKLEDIVFECASEGSELNLSGGQVVVYKMKLFFFFRI